MVSLLQDVIERGTGARARQLGVLFPVGGKTGTTDDYRDAWFAGFSSSVVAVVWVGFDDPRPIADEAYAARFALPIWSDFMRETASLLPPRAFAMPYGVGHERICRVSLQTAGSRCPAYTEVFKDDDARPGACAIHGGAPLQARSKWQRLKSAAFGWFGSSPEEREMRPARSSKAKKAKAQKPKREKRRRANDRDSDSDSR